MIESFQIYLPQAQVVPPKAAQIAGKSDIRKSAEDFEAMFITEMLKPMFDTIDMSEDPMFGGGEGEKMFQSFMTEEYGKNLAANGGIGIADSIEAQMLKYQEVKNG
jgi:Rod binding domain-containing protein